MMNADAGRQHIRRLPDRPIVGETYPNAGGIYKVDRYDAERDLAWVHRPKDGWKCCAHGPALYDVPGRGIAEVETLAQAYYDAVDARKSADKVTETPDVPEVDGAENTTDE